MRIPATIQAPDGLAPIPCIIIEDISRFGASLRSPGLSVPDEFVLSLNTSSSVRRACKVIWRECFAVGVQFTAQRP